MQTYTKRWDAAPPRFFAAEAAGLAWLAASGPGAAGVVRVREVAEDYITMDRLTPVRPSPAAAAAFGRALATTHAAGAAAFGVPPDGWTGNAFLGRQHLVLQPTASWGGFYAEQRLLPYAGAAADRGNLSASGLTAVEAVCARLVAGDYDDGRPPARIHGDLWSGNVLFTATGVVLIDPAAHGGHGLTDLAMLALFGAPLLATIEAAYAEAAALPIGWRELIGLHQLHPLLVHAVSHGAWYGARAAAIAEAYA